MLLLNPGPVTLTERVRGSLLRPDLCHRESEFFDLQDAVRAGVLSVYDLDPAEWTAVLLTGSGTSAVESMMAGLVPATGRVLTVENGVYGERIASMCAVYGIAHERLIVPWLEGVPIEAVEARLEASSGERAFSHVAVVHHETTTGRLNHLDALLGLCQARGLQLLVDGVSSFGAEAIAFGHPSLAAVAATANKCLHGVPGVSFVVLRRHALEAAVSRAYYLDLKRLSSLQDERNTPFTPAVHAYHALAEALREHADQGGRRGRHARYAALASRVREGLLQIGFAPLLAAEESSVVLRSYRLPNGLSYQALHDELKVAGFVIYAGQGELARSAFRISTMGDLHLADIERLVTCFARLMH